MYIHQYSKSQQLYIYINVCFLQRVEYEKGINGVTTPNNKMILYVTRISSYEKTPQIFHWYQKLSQIFQTSHSHSNFPHDQSQ